MPASTYCTGGARRRLLRQCNAVARQPFFSGGLTIRSSLRHKPESGGAAGMTGKYQTTRLETLPSKPGVMQTVGCKFYSAKNSRGIYVARNQGAGAFSPPSILAARLFSWFSPTTSACGRCSSRNSGGGLRRYYGISRQAVPAVSSRNCATSSGLEIIRPGENSVASRKVARSRTCPPASRASRIPDAMSHGERL